VATQNIFDLTDTWNNVATTFTAIKMNATDTASNAGSMLIDLQVGGTSQFSVTKGGAIVALGRATIATMTVGLGGQTTVASNTGVGVNVLNSASLTGANNTAFGNTALQNLTTGTGNNAFGSGAASATTTGSSNVAIGRSALSTNTTGTGNTAVGHQAITSASGATANTAVGTNALLLATGVENSAFGNSAGDVITTGARNTIIGHSSDPSAAAGVDQTVVGQGLTGKGDDTAFIGGTNGAYNEKNVITWEVTSDQRIKKNIVSNGVGLEVISQIDVRNFEYRTAEEITELPASAAIDQPGVQLGVIAQELQAVLPGCVTENSTGVLSVNTDQLIWYLVNSVKQLSAEVQALKGI